MINPRMKAKSDLLLMQLDLRDGTWGSDVIFFSPKRRWNHLLYWKRVGDYVVGVDCVGHIEPYQVIVDLLDGQRGGRLAHLETPQHGFEVDNILCDGGCEWLKEEFRKHARGFVDAT